MENPSTVLVFSNGCIAAFDATGEQIAELQLPVHHLWAAHAERLGFNPVGVRVEFQGGGVWEIEPETDGIFRRHEA